MDVCFKIKNETPDNILKLKFPKSDNMEEINNDYDLKIEHLEWLLNFSSLLSVSLKSKSEILLSNVENELASREKKIKDFKMKIKNSDEFFKVGEEILSALIEEANEKLNLLFEELKTRKNISKINNSLFNLIGQFDEKVLDKYASSESFLQNDHQTDLVEVNSLNYLKNKIEEDLDEQNFENKIEFKFERKLSDIKSEHVKECLNSTRYSPASLNSFNSHLSLNKDNSSEKNIHKLKSTYKKSYFEEEFVANFLHEVKSNLDFNSISPFNVLKFETSENGSDIRTIMRKVNSDRKENQIESELYAAPITKKMAFYKYKLRRASSLSFKKSLERTSIKNKNILFVKNRSLLEKIVPDKIGYNKLKEKSVRRLILNQINKKEFIQELKNLQDLVYNNLDERLIFKKFREMNDDLEKQKKNLEETKINKQEAEEFKIEFKNDLHNNLKKLKKNIKESIEIKNKLIIFLTNLDIKHINEVEDIIGWWEKNKTKHFLLYKQILKVDNLFNIIQNLRQKFKKGSMNYENFKKINKEFLNFSKQLELL